MSNAALLKVYDGQEPDLCFGTSPGPGGVNSVNVGAGLTKTGSSANPIVNLGTTAVGDLLVGTATANAATILPKGANGNFLRVKTDGSGLEYAAVAPGGVDSVSALANNVALVSTTAPASATDPQIGLAFTAKADVPVGTAANTGVMVSAPLPLTSGLFLQTDTGEASGVKWAPASGPSGAIGTNAPLVDEYDSGSGANTLSINFSAAKGEIPVGGGTAKTGILLPSSGNKGDVLSVMPTAPSGLAWVPPSGGGGGGPIIVRGTGGTPTAVAAPTSVNDTLIIVAEEDSAQPTYVPAPLPGGFPLSQYNIEFEMPAFSPPNGAGSVLLFGLGQIVNGQKCVELYVGWNGAQPTSVGHFYNSTTAAPGKYDAPASVSSVIAGPAGILADPGNFANSFVFGGTFTFFHTEAGVDIETHNIAQMVLPSTGVNNLQRLFSNQYPSGIFGLGTTEIQPQVVYNSQVNKLIYNPTDGHIQMYGCFNAIQTSAGNMPDGLGNPVVGFASIAEYDINGDFDLPGSLIADGLGVYAPNFPAQAAAVGVITDAEQFVTTGGPYPGATILMIVGEFQQLAIDSTSNLFAPPQFGFAVWVSGLAPNHWQTTPSVPAAPGNTFVGAFTIRPSLAFGAGYFVFSGIESDPTVSPSDSPRVYVYGDVNTASPAVQQATGDITSLTPTDFNAVANSITGLTIDIGAGSAPHDFIMTLNETAKSIRVFYMTGASLATTNLTPTPTGLVPIVYDNPNPGQALYVLDPEFTAFGLQPTFGNTTPGLVVAAENSKEQWTPPSASNTVFTGEFYYDNTQYTTATFAPTAGTNLDSSQMLVSTKSQLGWINVGAKATSLTYS